MSAGSEGRRTTLADVAARAGVDRSVISRVLSGDSRLLIRDETRQRVLDAVRELGYRPNAAARTLRTQRTGTLGLLIPDYANPVYAEIIKGAETVAAERDCVLLTGSADADRGLGSYLDLLGQGRVDGLLLAGEMASKEALDGLTADGLPWLLVNRTMRGEARHVVLDDERAAGLAVRHLVELGHTEIAHLAGPSSSNTAQRRARGYRAALREHGLEVPSSLTARTDYSADGGYRAMFQLLDAQTRPTAVFVANLASAIGALHALRTQGVDAPGAMSVIAVHDLPLVEHISPALTTVRMPLRELGRRGVELLSDLGPNDTVKEVVTGPMDVVVRESTAPPR
ncbi:LacI family transcriptional regulator [Haloactinopolyspora alba]|uniref:LacI family transcriptional regulator n=1 Tax=Haloactinopolyspora alba TaxID=648780 RepID=A0A2P8EFJ6_9ACTN|nr:LacI family DNA-binding transcriptional regulator [Haloactinopolyspora alba]PSL08221.1 LacI family transcriptional regulator [Haloactinopolyspora alba]